MKRPEKWYQRRLAAYCEKKYGSYANEMEFHVDPSIRQWEIVIPRLYLRTIITCDDFGAVFEEKSVLRGTR